MKYKYFVLLSFLTFVGIQLSAQIRVSTWDYDFGNVELWENQPAIFEITNTSSKTLVFLPTFPDDDLYLYLPVKSLKPGETTELHAIYYTEKKGRFKRPFKIYTNLSSEPLELSVNGKIELVDINARTVCPGSNVAEKELLAIAEIKNKRAMLETKPMAPDVGEMMIRSFEKQHPELVAKEKLREEQQNKSNEKENQGDLAIVPNAEEAADTKSLDSKEEESEDVLAVLTKKELEVQDKEELKAPSNKPKVPNRPKVANPPVRRPAQKPRPKPKTKTEAPKVASKPIPAFEDEDLAKENQKEEVLNVISNRDNDQNQTTVPDTGSAETKSEPKASIAENIKTKKADIPVPADVREPITLNVKDYSANNVVFLIDVSTSMKDKDKLPLLKESMVQMAKVMRGIDKVTVITYSTKPSIALQPTAADNTEDIVGLIESLEASGRTNGVMGLQEAYRLIRQQFIAGGNNQIILATDGLFNQYHPDYTEKDLMSLVRKRAKEDNIKVSVIGFGDDNKARRMMSRLAANGGGNFLSIDEDSSESALVDEIKKQSGRR